MKIFSINKQSLNQVLRIFKFVQTGARVSNDSGDMKKSVYDPENVEGDAFDMENMSEGVTNKILTAIEKAGPTLAEAQAGTSTVSKLWSALRITQRIAAWAFEAASEFAGKIVGATTREKVYNLTASGADPTIRLSDGNDLTFRVDSTARTINIGPYPTTDAWSVTISLEAEGLTGSVGALTWQVGSLTVKPGYELPDGSTITPDTGALMGVLKFKNGFIWWNPGKVT